MSYIRTTLLLLLLPATAFAQDKASIEKAKSYFYAGEQAYKIGQYRAAISAYEEAYRLYPAPAFLFNTAQAHRKQYDLDGDLAQLKLAKDLYERFLREDPTSPRKPQAQELLAETDGLIKSWRPPAVQPKVEPARPETQAILTSTPPGAEVAIDTRDFSLGGRTPYIRKVEPGRHVAYFRSDGYEPAEVSFDAEEGKLVPAQALLREIPATVKLTSNLAGADVTIDGIPVGMTPLLPRTLSPGVHHVVVTSRGHQPWAQTIDLPRGGSVDLAAKLEVTTRRRAAWIGFAGAGVLVVAGTITGVLALSAKSDVDAYAKRVIKGTDTDTYNSLAASANDRALATDILFGCAAATAGASAYLYWFDRPAPEGGPKSQGVGVVYQGHF
jgi:hypothetical protein